VLANTNSSHTKCVCTSYRPRNVVILMRSRVLTGRHGRARTGCTRVLESWLAMHF
jgi:hypothetical protein